MSRYCWDCGGAVPLGQERYEVRSPCGKQELVCVDCAGGDS